MHLKLPLTIIAKRDDKASASSIEWVVRTTVTFLWSEATLSMTFHMYLLALGSIPVDGSSRNKTVGFPNIATAVDNLRLLPPDKVPESLSLYR